MLEWCEETSRALATLGHLFPHLLFVGRREDVVEAALKHFLSDIGRGYGDSDVLVHECEANGGISAVREILRPFTRSPRHPRPALVILLRFDRLSPDAQFALRRTMEIDQDKCRCLAAATSTASIIQPLHSRFVPIECCGEPEPPIIRLADAGEWRDCVARGIEGLAAMGPCDASRYARGGVCGCDVLGWLEERAEAAEVPWRLVVAAELAAECVKDEATAILGIGGACDDHLRGRPYAVHVR